MSALQSFGPDIWITDGPILSFYGFRYSTRMAIIKLESGALFLWSPVALTAGLKTEIDALGPVTHLVSPNALHHLFLREWKDAYPSARLCGTPGLARKCKDLRFDALLGDTPDAAWRGELDQVEMAGSLALTEIVFFHRKSRTAHFCDLIQNFPPGWFTGWRAILARLDGIVMPHAGAPREWRLTFCRRKLARARLARILAWKAEKVVLAHGAPVREHGAEFIRRSFRWLKPAD